MSDPMKLQDSDAGAIALRSLTGAELEAAYRAAKSDETDHGRHSAWLIGRELIRRASDGDPKPLMTPNKETDTAEQLKLARAAIHRTLTAIATDPKKYWLMGDGTESWEKLTTAAAALWHVPVEKIRADFMPRKEAWERYCDEVAANERLLTHCRENNIKP